MNKICALVGRAEPRDLIDLHFFHSQGLDLDDAISQAPSKDGGVGRDALLLALQGISPAQLDETTKKFLSNLIEKLKLELLPLEYFIDLILCQKTGKLGVEIGTVW